MALNSLAGLPNQARGSIWFRDRDAVPDPACGEVARSSRVPLVDRLLATPTGDTLSRLFFEPNAAGKILVLHSRRAFGPRQDWPGLFSEFHSVLGALTYAAERGAAGVRVCFEAPNYVQAGMGNNWWDYFFERSLMMLHPGQAPEVHLNKPLARYGRYWGFGGIVYGPIPFLYPMAFGVPRGNLAAIVTRHVAVRQEILDQVAGYVAANFSSPFILGLHYRGTDTARHYPYYKIPYESFLAEARRVLESAAPSDFRLFVAADEAPFLERVERDFPGRVLCWPGSPRVQPHEPSPHLDGKHEHNYAKGESAIIDSLLLSRTSYLIKARSNLSDASLVFNSELPYSFCLY